MSLNNYGLDVQYFYKKLECILRDIELYSPSEMKIELRKLVTVAEYQENSLPNPPEDK